MPSPKLASSSRIRTLIRVIGALVGMLVGLFYGLFIITNAGGYLSENRSVALAALLSAGVAGAASLALAAPLLTIDPFLWLEDILERAPPSEIFGALIGLIIALAIAALCAILLSALPWGMGLLLSLCLACVLVYVGVRTGRRRRQAFVELFRGQTPMAARGGAPELAPIDGLPILVDTSVLIDGRLPDVAATGFIQGRLLITTFVLEELQRVADSGDAVRRARGRRGLDSVDALRAAESVIVEVVDTDIGRSADVDLRLMRLAKIRRAAIITNDYNLNRIAQVEGIRVLNLNDLANALKPVKSAGESLDVRIVKAGREPQQGVGYLDDGTMVVVEGGRDHLENSVTVTVTSVLQTPSGRMIFGTVKGAEAPRSRARPQRGPRGGRP